MEAEVIESVRTTTTIVLTLSEEEVAQIYHLSSRYQDGSVDKRFGNRPSVDRICGKLVEAGAVTTLVSQLVESYGSMRP